VWTGILVTVASMVGVGILTTSGYIIQGTESPSMLLTLWIVGGVVSLAGALTYAELATLLPRAGGDYVFVRTAFGDPAAFTYGWATLLLGFAGPTAVIAHAMIEYALLPLRVHWTSAGQEWPAWVTPLGASSVILVFSVLHMLGQRSSSWSQNATTAFKFALLTTFVVVGLGWGAGDWGRFAAGRGLLAQDLGAAGASLVYVFYGYSGWNASAYLAGEISDPARNLPRAILGGCLAVTLLYLAMNVTYIFALGPDGLREAAPQEVEAIAESAARRLFGPHVSQTLSVLIGLSILASVSAYLLTGSRVCYAMSCDGMFPSYAARVHASRGTPVLAILTQGTAAISLLCGSQVLAGEAAAFRSLLNYTSIGLVLLTSLGVGSLLVLRRRGLKSPHFAIPLYPVPPLLFLVVTLWLTVLGIRENPWPTLLGIATVFSGWPLYRWCRPWLLRTPG
jgi:APA family basic amino acid/polyamine antiporter